MSNPNQPSNPSAAAPVVLIINGGSSSIKFAVFTNEDPPQRRLRGQIERIGRAGTQLTAQSQDGSIIDSQPIEAGDYSQAAQKLIRFIKDRLEGSSIAGIGHRIVHGGIHYVEHQLITPELIAALRNAEPIDLTHLPREIALVEAFAKAFPSLLQFACFDTAFHKDLPTVARQLPIPRRYFDQGIRRFGFHGLSYTYLMQQLAIYAGEEAANGRVLLAHLGSGASMAAVRNGKPIDTTMSFTPAAGLVMSTRPGDLDPGLLVYLMRSEHLTPDQLDDVISNHCGLLGVSETSGDMRDLLNNRATDPRAAEAVNLFCYQAKKFVGALVATLGGLDTLIFTGGIGEHCPEVRAAICGGLEFLGLRFDPSQNKANAQIISAPLSHVTVRIIPTDEESVIAENVVRLSKQPA